MAQKIWFEPWKVDEGTIEDGAPISTQELSGSEEFLALTPADVAAVIEAIRTPDRCDRCDRGKVYADMYDANPTPCAECCGTGRGPQVRKVLEMLR